MTGSYDKIANLLARDVSPPPEQIYYRPAREPATTFNSFRALAAIEDENGWPAPTSSMQPATRSNCVAACCATKSASNGPGDVAEETAARITPAPAKQDASASQCGQAAKPRSGRRRKYVALCLRDEVLLQAVTKETAWPGY